MAVCGALILFFTLLPDARGFEIKGFSDVDYIKSTLDGDENENGTFALGAIDLYASELITDNIEVLMEVAFEAGIVDVERIQIGYIFNDALKVRAGRVHNILGYWNVNFHHGKQIQTTIDRPFFIKFEDEGGLIPVHLVGLWTSGRYAAGPVILGYDVMLGNGSKIVNIGGPDVTELNPNNESDDNRNKAISFRLQVSPRFMNALKLMVSGSVSKVAGFDSNDLLLLEVDQNILNFSVVYDQQGEPFELLSEVYWVQNEDKLTNLGKNKNTLYYVQVGYTLMDLITPYFRYEQSTIEEDDPYMIALSAVDTKIALAGIRYELSTGTALKAEFRKIRADGVENYSEYAVQWSFAF
jgi:hypothetical protein